MSTRTQQRIFTEINISRSRLCNPRFLSGIYLKYLFTRKMSLFKSLYAIMIVNFILTALTGATIVPIIQLDGTKVDLKLVVALMKLLELLLSLYLLKEIVFAYAAIRRNSRLAYAT